MKPGKLDNETLDRLILSKFKQTRAESYGPPRIGMDCATLDFSDDLIVTSCDPITSADWQRIGALSVHVNCNDAAAGGAEPVGLLVTLLLPTDATEEIVDHIATDLQRAAQLAGVDILGGHTEVTDAVSRVVTCTTVLARMPKANAMQGAEIGDDLVMTKWAGLEGTMLIAQEHQNLLQAVYPDLIAEACRLDSFLSVVPESRIAKSLGAHAMHDVTEGGVLGAVWEIAAQNHLGAVVDPDVIPVLPCTRAITDAIGLDPYRLMASGSMLIACSDGNRMCEALKAEGIAVAVIGKITDSGFVFTDGTPIDPPRADELYRLF